MGTKREKKKAGGARRGPQSYVKKLKDKDGRIVERLRTKKGTPFRWAILGGKRERFVECATQFTRLVDNLEVYHACTKPKGHDGFHGFGNGISK